MRSLLEKAILNLLNGDEEKAAALFHKFMVERARQIHESLRQNEGLDESLDEDWNSEITEEEYFGDDELADEPADDAAPVMHDGDDGMAAPDADMPPADEAPVDGDGDFDGDDMDDDFGADEAPEGVEDKIDSLTDKIDDLTAQFDRLMAEFGDDDVSADSADDLAGDDDADDFGGDADTFDEPADDLGGETDDLADRMDDDMGDEDETAPDHQMAECAEPVEEDDESMSDDVDDDDLSDITESVLAELDKIAAPSNTDGKGIGSNSQPNNISNTKPASPIPHHNVMDRIKGEPVMTKGPTHSGFEREAAPPVKGGETLVKGVRKANQRKSFKDTMGTVPAKGDASAELNKDFANGPKPTKSIVDGKTSKG